MLFKVIAALSAAAVMAVGVNAYDDWDDYYWNDWNDDDYEYFYDWHYGEYVSGDFYYNENSDGTVTITDYALRDATELEIPSQLEGKAVTAIGDSAFEYMTELRRVNIPDSVTEIGLDAFKGCKMLEEVVLPKNTDIIPPYCFYGCTSLKSIVIPDGVKEIGYGAFINCDALKEVHIPSTVNSINYSAFMGCDDMTLYCRRGSEAARYAKDRGIDYVEETPPAEETALALGIVGAVWGAIVLVIVVCVVIVKKREKGDD